MATSKEDWIKSTFGFDIAKVIEQSKRQVAEGRALEDKARGEYAEGARLLQEAASLSTKQHRDNLPPDYLAKNDALVKQDTDRGRQLEAQGIKDYRAGRDLEGKGQAGLDVANAADGSYGALQQHGQEVTMLSISFANYQNNRLNGGNALITLRPASNPKIPVIKFNVAIQNGLASWGRPLVLDNDGWIDIEVAVPPQIAGMVPNGRLNCKPFNFKLKPDAKGLKFTAVQGNKVVSNTHGTTTEQTHSVTEHQQSQTSTTSTHQVGVGGKITGEASIDEILKAGGEVSGQYNYTHSTTTQDTQGTDTQRGVNNTTSDQRGDSLQLPLFDLTVTQIQ